MTDQELSAIVDEQDGEIERLKALTAIYRRERDEARAALAAVNADGRRPERREALDSVGSRDFKIDPIGDAPIVENREGVIEGRGYMRAEQAEAALAQVRQEECICAAVEFRDGRIVRGHRHDACFRTAEGWTPKPDAKGCTQGFITSHNRFVDRTEGAKLQNAAGIVSAHTGQPINDLLFSEDLYFASHDHAAALTPVAHREPQPLLHNTIMNLACIVPIDVDEKSYRLGHRDARHNAAEKVLAFSDVGEPQPLRDKPKG